MKFTPNYKDYYLDKYTGYLLFDAQVWYDHFASQNGAELIVLEEEQKVQLMEFLIKDACSNHKVTAGGPIVDSHQDHSYSHNFEKPSVIDEHYDVIPSQTDDGYFSYSLTVMRQALDVNSTYSSDKFGHFKLDFVKREDLSNPPLNKIKKEMPEVIGRVIMKRKHPFSNTHMIHRILECVNFNYDEGAPRPLMYSIYRR